MHVEKKNEISSLLTPVFDCFSPTLSYLACYCFKHSTLFFLFFLFLWKLLQQLFVTLACLTFTNSYFSFFKFLSLASITFLSVSIFKIFLQLWEIQYLFCVIEEIFVMKMNSFMHIFISSVTGSLKSLIFYFLISFSLSRSLFSPFSYFLCFWYI